MKPDERRYYLEEKINKKFIINKTGLFKTKKGLRVFISVIDVTTVHGCIEGYKYTSSWWNTGEMGILEDPERDKSYDIISEW